jgi:transposase-like protein
MPKHYPAELRRRTCERMLAGEAVKDLTAELGIAGVTLYKWRRQALIDAGIRLAYLLARPNSRTLVNTPGGRDKIAGYSSSLE